MPATAATATSPKLVHHVAILRVVRPGHEAEFEAVIERFFEEAAAQPGVCGAYLIRPFSGSPSPEYGILRSFRSRKDAEQFYDSALYRKLNAALAPLTEGEPQREELHGMEAFFRDRGAPPPRWKMALLTWVGVNPAVYVFSHGVHAVFGGLPTLAAFLLVNALVVISLAWFFMPILTRIAHGWLHPATRAPSKALGTT